MTADSQPSKRTYKLIVFYRFVAANSASTVTRRELTIKESTDPLELIDYARELLKHNLIYEFYVVPKALPTTGDDDLITTWIELANKALAHKGALAAEYTNPVEPPHATSSDLP